MRQTMDLKYRIAYVYILFPLNINNMLIIGYYYFQVSGILSIAFIIVIWEKTLFNHE